MTWNSIENIPRQWLNQSDNALLSGYWLIAFKAGTTTRVNMAIDASGGGQALKFQTNSAGYLVTSGNVVITPFVEEPVKLAVVPTEAEADASDISNAIWPTIDNVKPLGFGATKQVLNITELKALDTNAFTHALTLYHTYPYKGAGQYRFDSTLNQSLADDFIYILPDSGTGLWQLIPYNEIYDIYQTGAKGDDVEDDFAKVEAFILLDANKNFSDGVFRCNSTITISFSNGEQKITMNPGSKINFYHSSGPGLTIDARSVEGNLNIACQNAGASGVLVTSSTANTVQSNRIRLDLTGPGRSANRPVWPGDSGATYGLKFEKPNGPVFFNYFDGKIHGFDSSTFHDNGANSNHCYNVLVSDFWFGNAISSDENTLYNIQWHSAGSNAGGDPVGCLFFDSSLGSKGMGLSTGGSSTTMVDTGQSYTTDELVGGIIMNTSDKCFGVITSNTSNTVTCIDGFTNGINNDFGAGDGYVIVLDTPTLNTIQGMNEAGGYAIWHPAGDNTLDIMDNVPLGSIFQGVHYRSRNSQETSSLSVNNSCNINSDIVSTGVLLALKKSATVSQSATHNFDFTATSNGGIKVMITVIASGGLASTYEITAGCSTNPSNNASGIVSEIYDGSQGNFVTAVGDFVISSPSNNVIRIAYTNNNLTSIDNTVDMRIEGASQSWT